jgi:hypothetical protein
MTETTSIQHFMRERHTFAPVVHQPGLATFIGQAAVGSFCGSFVVMLVRVLFVYQPRNGFFAFYVPFLMMSGLATGAVAGLLIWAGTKEADGPLLGITRTLLGVLVMGLAWFALWYFLFREDITSEALLWMLAVVGVSGLSIGLVTGSRLRLWRELVRGGETKELALRILAGLVGLVLRSVVVFLFLAYLIIAIASVQSYFFGRQPKFADEITSMVWYLVFMGHFATGTIILFARVRFWPLVLLTVISIAPVVASLWMVEMTPEERYIVTGYLVAWAMFLVTRWRLMDAAVATLKEEFRYYLID